MNESFPVASVWGQHARYMPMWGGGVRRGERVEGVRKSEGTVPRIEGIYAKVANDRTAWLDCDQAAQG